MDKYLKQVVDIFEEMELKYELNEEKKIVELGFRTPNDQKIEVIIAVQSKLRAIKVFVPYLAQFPIEKAPELFFLINKFNRKLLFSGLSARVHKRGANIRVY